MNENAHNIEPQPKRRGRPPKAAQPARLSDLGPMPEVNPVPVVKEDLAGLIDLREAPRGAAVVQPVVTKLIEEVQEELRVNPPEPVPGKTWSPLLINDVVQVANDKSKDYGLLFTIGDVRDGKVHGFRVNLGQIDYVTVPEGDCVGIGPSKVRSRNPCSPKWAAENK